MTGEPSSDVLDAASMEAQAMDHPLGPGATSTLGPERVPARSVSAPDLVGSELVGAHLLARSVGLRLSVSVHESTVGPWGMVLAQSPPPDTPLRGGSRLRIIVSGRPPIVVPDIRGTSLEDGRDALKRFGFSVARIRQRRNRGIPPGHVISTSPKAGSLAAWGDPVEVTVSRVDPQVSADDPAHRRC